MCAGVQCVSFSRALLTGYGDDGGMLLPATIPRLSPEALQSLRALPYQELLARLLALFVDPEELPIAELRPLLKRSFARFESPFPPSPTSTAELSYTGLQYDGQQLLLLNMWHGPTLTFKDVALQPLAVLLERVHSASSPAPLHILVGTSGDTGSAAISAVSSLRRVQLYVLYPWRRISRLQELQMTTSDTAHAHVVAVDGSSDDLDAPIKAVFDDQAFADQHRLTSINSINVARVLLQTAHLFHAALGCAFPDADSAAPASLVLPSGALGQLVAALLCRRLGLPVRRLVVATNDNRAVADLITTGTYRPAPAAVVTSSCAMDINAAYNVERLLYLLAQGEHAQRAARVRQCLAELESAGEFRLREEEREELRVLGVVAASVSEAEVQRTMRDVWLRCGELIDPHTAVGVAAAASLLAERAPGERVFCVSTAHPAKFTESVSKAVGLSPEALAQRWALSPSAHVRRTQTLEGKPTRSALWHRGEDWAERLRQLIRDTERESL